MSTWYSKTQSDTLLAQKADLVGGVIPPTQIPPAIIPTRTSIVHIGGSGGQSPANNVGQLLCRTPARFAQTAKRYRIKVSQRSLLDDSTVANAVPLDGLWFGEAAFDSTGNLTSGFTAAPTQVLGAVTVPSDGSQFVSSWISDSSVPIAGRTYLLSYSANYPSGNIVRGSGWTFYNTGNATAAAGQAALAPANALDATVLDIEIEYEATTNRSVVMFLGDSLTDGWKSGYGVATSYPTIYGQITGSLPIVNAYAGALSSQFTTASHTKYTRYAGLSVDAVHIGLGTNDLSQSGTVASVQANLASIIGIVRSIWGRDVLIYANTIQPFGGSGTNETNRTTYNTWLRSMPYGIAGIIDFDRVVRNPASTASLDVDYNQGDNIHLKAAGHRAEALALPVRVRHATA